MPVNFDWNLDAGSSDLQSLLSLDLSVPSGSGEPKPSTSTSSQDDNTPKPESSCHLLEEDDTGADPEFFMSSEMAGNSLPNDDIWKKFDIFDTDETRKLDDQLTNMFDDLTNLTWMNPMYSQAITNDAREIRNHDCMWAGHCISEKHERNNPKNTKCTNLLPIKKPQPPRLEDTDLIPLTTSEGPAFGETGRVFGRKNGVVAPTHARSVLLPSRVVSSTATARKPPSPKSHTVTTSLRTHRSRTLDSGGESPRPETPQSLSDHEDLNLDLPDMKTVEDYVADAFGYNFISDIVDNIGSEGTSTFGSGDDFTTPFDRYPQGSSWNVTSSATTATATITTATATTTTTATLSTRSVGNKVKRAIVRQEVPVARHYTDNSFFSDHCYHLSKNARMDNLGVQTPSDSELVGGTSETVETPRLQLRPSEGARPRKEEIDVETVYGELRKPNSRSSSSGSVLPTNPSFSDRQQLQLTVASAINKKDVKKQSARTSTVQARNSVGEDRTLKAKVVAGGKRKTNAKNEVKRTGCNKRGAQFDDLNELLNKTVKKKKCQAQNASKSGKGKGKRNGRNSGRSSGGGSSDSEVDSIERRTIHNSMERQRRIDLRNSFEELRKLIPSTAGNEKAAKVLILSSGADFCRALAMEDHELTRKRAELRRQQEMLMARVSQLRRSLAAQR